VAAQPVLEQREELVPLRSAGLDEPLALEDPEDLAGDRRPDGVVRST